MRIYAHLISTFGRQDLSRWFLMHNIIRATHLLAIGNNRLVEGGSSLLMMMIGNHLWFQRVLRLLWGIQFRTFWRPQDLLCVVSDDLRGDRWLCLFDRRNSYGHGFDIMLDYEGSSNIRPLCALLLLWLRRIAIKSRSSYRRVFVKVWLCDFCTSSLIIRETDNCWSVKLLTLEDV